MIYPTELIEALLENKNITLYSKIEVLDWEENSLKDITGKILPASGGVNMDGSSAVRRTANLSMLVDSDYERTEVVKLISDNNKVRLYVGMENNAYGYEEFDNILWFNAGIFILESTSINYTIEGGIELSITLQDKMNLLNGEMSGELTEVVRLDTAVEVYKDADKDVEYDVKINLVEMLYNLIQEFGRENPAKIIINDIPLKIKAPIKYVGTADLTLTTNKNTSIVLKTGDIVGYKHMDFVYQDELVKSPGDTIYSVLEDIKNYLGNFEFFYDADGNFIFQEIKNYINSSFTPIQQLNTQDYLVNYSNTPFIYSFENANLITGISKEEINKNIKNDFKVMGISKNDKGVNTTIIYHVIIYPKPNIPFDYKKTWQDYIVENNITDFPYYKELKQYWPTEVDKDGKPTGGNGVNYYYHFDIIDSNTTLGQFSIDKIGYRTKVVYDENINCLYPNDIKLYNNQVIYYIFKSDYLLYTKADGTKVYDEIAFQKQQTEYKNNGNEFIVFNDDTKDKDFAFLANYNDAYSKIREMLYTYTSYSDTVNISSIPLYFLDVNKLISINYQDINGNFIINSMNIPFNIEEQMNISTIKVQNRI